MPGIAQAGVFIGGQQGFPEGLNYSNKLKFAPRAGISHHIHKHGIVLHAAFGIFFTPVFYSVIRKMTEGREKKAVEVMPNPATAETREIRTDLVGGDTFEARA